MTVNNPLFKVEECLELQGKQNKNIYRIVTAEFMNICPLNETNSATFIFLQVKKLLKIPFIFFHFYLNSSYQLNSYTETTELHFTDYLENLIKNILIKFKNMKIYIL